MHPAQPAAPGRPGNAVAEVPAADGAGAAGRHELEPVIAGSTRNPCWQVIPFEAWMPGRARHDIHASFLFAFFFFFLVPMSAGFLGAATEKCSGFLDFPPAAFFGSSGAACDFA